MTRYNHGDIITYEVRAEDAFGVGITNANMHIQQRRRADDAFFNGATWQAAVFNIPMIEKSDTVNLPGIWTLNFDTGPHNSVDDYITEFIDISGNAVNAPFVRDENQVGGYLDSIDADLARILGLNHDNFVHDPTDYDINGRMVTGETRMYNSKANALLDDGATGLLFKYTVTSARTVQGFLAKFTQTRET